MFEWVHRELDSTAASTGPTHRNDPVHSENWIGLRAPQYYNESSGMTLAEYVLTAMAVAKLHIETDRQPISNRDDKAAHALVNTILYGTPYEPQPYYDNQRPQMSPHQQADHLKRSIRRVIKSAEKGWKPVF